MVETSITLYVELRQGTRLDLESAANAALAWSRMIKAIGQSVDPMADWVVELDSSLPGSQKIKSLLSTAVGGDIGTLMIGAVGAALFFLVKESVAWGTGEILDYLTGPDAPTEAQSLSEEEMNAIATRIAAILQGTAGQSEAIDVYKALESDPDVTGVGETTGSGTKPTVIIPRAAFPTRREIEAPSDPEERTVTERLDVVLL